MTSGSGRSPAAGRSPRSTSSTATWARPPGRRSGRVGFAELVSRVTLGDVGIIFSYDVTRLSRNCSDWYQLLDLCGFRHCLIGDHDGIYDPSSINGRMLLGLKGQISELELHTIKARLHAGLINKATARRAGPEPAGRPGARPVRPGRQAPRPGSPGADRLHLRHLPAGKIDPRRGPRAGGRPAAPATPRAGPRRRCRRVAATDGGGALELAPQPGLRRDLRLRPDAVPAARARRAVSQAPVAPGAVAVHGPRQVPRVHRPGDLRDDPGDAPRQLPGVQPSPESRGGPVRLGPAAGPGLLRPLRAGR